MSERDYAPLSIACVRGLCDKIYDKRKFAGVEIEKMVKDFNEANNTSQIKRLVRVLGQDLMASSNPNVKNGALMGLSSVAVGLGKGCVEYLPELVGPMAACALESESRVRYAACEALFNAAKIARAALAPHLPALFDALARLAADPEPQVRQAAEMLDRLLKDIVTESGAFEVGALVGLLRERMYSRQAATRQFLVSWLSVLDAVPALQGPLVRLLPDLLDPLFKMLDDPNPEIRRMCEVQLSEFLRSIKKEPAAADVRAMINTLITHAQSPEELVQLTALTWLKEFLALNSGSSNGGSLRPFASGVLAAVLPCLAYADDTPNRNKIREIAATVNLQLSRLIVTEESTEESTACVGEGKKEATSEGGDDGAEKGGGGSALPVGAVVGVLTQMLHHSSVHTKVAAIDWILQLYNKLPQEMLSETDKVFVVVVGVLTDPNDDVVRRSLAVLAEICSASTQETGELESSPYYHKFLRALLRLLAADENLLEDRGAFIIRQLCVLLNAEEVYRALAALLPQQRDLRFVATAVDVLATILLTAAELYHLRHQLRRFDKPATHELFTALYACWCHSGVSLLALCLLTHNYAHCNDLIATFGDLEITVDFLTEVDKLVQLIESPIFAYMRLELLGGAQSGELRGALYGLLMLLPQSDAFHALRTRLQCAPAEPYPPLRSLAAAPPPPAPAIDFAALLVQFRRAQAAQRDYKMADRARADRSYT